MLRVGTVWWGKRGGGGLGIERRKAAAMVNGVGFCFWCGMLVVAANRTTPVWSSDGRGL